MIFLLAGGGPFFSQVGPWVNPMYFIPQGGEAFKGEILENMAGFLRNQSKRQTHL